ncbi:MAG: FAD-dependent oxidoreductase [Alphaproteobacteria bacterium]|nr:FAD-dependent oxidoreductase [Alphaproteobacteria bacterium]
MRSNEHVLVAGSGIAGLGAALAFGGGTRRVTIVDRDPPPPAGSAEEAFYSWERRGATQLRHSHAFLGRLTTLIRERYPDLMAELLHEGTRLFGFEDGLTPTLAQGYVPSKGDEDLKLLFSRRTTLELILRRYTARQVGVTFINDAGVRGPIVRHDDGKLYVDGLKVEHNDAVKEMRADVTVDATGRNTLFPDWLRVEGATIKEDSKPCGILYYTRHYKLRDGQDEPPRGGNEPPGGGDLGYIKFGVFIADNRHFSVTLAVPEIESVLRTAIVKPENFDAACLAMPGAARWVDPKRAEPVSRVFSMGELHNVWRHYVKDGVPQALNFFAIGDAAVRTNPLYGRGCSSGVVEAHLLRAALDSSDDPVERALTYEREITKAIRPYYDSMVQLDLQAIRRAQHERDPNYQPGLRARIMKSFTEDALMPAQRGNVDVSRAMSRVFHMLDEPQAMLRNPRVLAGVLGMWATSGAEKKRRGLYPAKMGPDRAGMMKLLNIAA